MTRAPPGKEVEELSKKEIITALRNKVPLEQAITEMADIGKKEEKQEEISELNEFGDFIKKLPGTLDAYLLDESKKEIAKVSVRDLIDTLKNSENIHTIVFDGVVTQRLVDVASDKNVKRVIGVKVGNINKKPLDMEIMAFK